MGDFAVKDQVLIWRENRENVWIQPWGQDGLRVQANVVGSRLDLPQALLAPDRIPSSKVFIEMGEAEAVIRNGAINATISRAGRFKYANSASGSILLEEPDLPYYAPPNRQFEPKGGSLFKIQARFRAQVGERFYGLGQHQHGRLDQKGCVIELQQRNTEIAIPFLISNRRYGFLWNNPSIGRVELGFNGTRWVAEGAQQLDYYVVCGDGYKSILKHYADATGHAPPLPQWASGLWQCKLRYETQEELLGVASEYKRRGLPLSLIVIDFFNWTQMGDWKFDPKCWPDPKAMVRELKQMGVELMVSIWPTVSPLSENYETMKEQGLLVSNDHGVDAQFIFPDSVIARTPYFSFYDATNPEARRFIWDTVKKNYYDFGVRHWWLDEDDPDVNPWQPENLRFSLGNGIEVANIYPLLHQTAFYEGMRAAGETEIMTLSRSGWAGTQRLSSVIWSGDLFSTFETLQAQIPAGLNMAMSGIPWWTTDIGGIWGGDIRDPHFRELIVRWFQYSVFCPILRMHGRRMPYRSNDPNWAESGEANELWSFGEQAYEILRPWLFLRERLRPYIHEQMQTASERGLPPMRPLFVDFPSDATCETVEDEFMFGPEILVAPVLHDGARGRKVYLPTGTDWVDAWGGTKSSGGEWITAPAPLDTIPVFLTAENHLEGVFETNPTNQ